MRILRGLIIAILLIFSSACNEQTPSLKKLPSDALILAFGDSLTYGSGASSQQDYPSVLAKLSGRVVINEGVPGEVSSDGLGRLPALLDEYEPDLLILIHGGNDILKKIPSQLIANNLTSMIAAAKARRIDILLLGVPEPGLLTMESAPFYGQIAKQTGVLMDLETLPEILGDNEMKSDLIHPNNSGYHLLANSIYDRLKSAGAF